MRANYGLKLTAVEQAGSLEATRSGLVGKRGSSPLHLRAGSWPKPLLHLTWPRDSLPRLQPHRCLSLAPTSRLLFDLTPGAGVFAFVACTVRRIGQTGVVLKRRIEINDLMQQGYVYLLTEPPGRNFHPDFRPQLTPSQMLGLGVFGGKYMTDCSPEYPADWFDNARLCPDRHDPELNCFGVNASQPLAVWRAKGWIYHEDPRGWFQWYCRYFLGRRCPDDERQIKRWRAIRRHVRQVEVNCHGGDLDCRRRQRQALLHWAYDSRRI